MQRVGFAAVPQATWVPADHGLLTWTFDPASGAGSNSPTSGTLQVARVHLPVAATVTNIILSIGTGGTTLTTGQSFAGLYTAAGTRVGATADQAASWASTGTKTIALTAPYAAAAGDYYVAWYSVGTTPPAFVRGSGNALVNAGLSGSTARFGTADTGLTTALPATMGAKTVASNAFWAALS